MGHFFEIKHILIKSVRTRDIENGLIASIKNRFYRQLINTTNYMLVIAKCLIISRPPRVIMDRVNGVFWWRGNQMKLVPCIARWVNTIRANKEAIE